MDLCNLRELRPLLERHGFRFSKALGQNFLIDPAVPPAIAGGAELDKQTGVVEIGPGVGTLTAALSRAAGRVLCLELDRALLPVLEETLSDYPNVTVLQEDALKADLPALCASHLPGLRLCACANLPYYITSPAISSLIDAGIFASITVMVQREVARRLCAAPGSKAYGAFTVYVNYYYAPSVFLEVPSSSFVPVPNVDSSVVHMTRLNAPPAKPQNERLFWSVVKASFAQRRKTLVNGLYASFSSRISKQSLADLVSDCGLDPSVRGETLSIEQFCRLSDLLFQRLG